MKFLLFCMVLCFAPSGYGQSEPLQAVQLYTQDQLIALINKNEHLNKVMADRCQLVQDIEAHAEVLKEPSYQFLWGDMLAWGVCVEADPTRGIRLIQEAGQQGLPAALEQLGRYYKNATLVQQDLSRAVIFLREAAALGNLNAQLQLAELFIEGHGSPYDYEDAYRWLHQAITADPSTHNKVTEYLQALKKLMHPKAVRRARSPL